jgi:putative transcriptional regulator
MKWLILSMIVFTILFLNTAVSAELGWMQDLPAGRPLQISPQREITKGVFLVAGPQLLDPNFRKTVVLVIHHGLDGTLGIVINRPTTTALSRLLPDTKEFQGQPDTVYIGGPVFQQVLLLLLRSRIRLQSANQVLDDVYFSQDMNMLTDMFKQNSQKGAFRVYAGHAGWAPGQLEDEFERGDWRVIRADSGTVFEKDPDTVWPEMIQRSSEQKIKGLHRPVLPILESDP